MAATYGDFKLASVANLPNVFVAFPGEHWSDGKAGEVIVPGELVTQTNSGGRKTWMRAATSAKIGGLNAIALRTVDLPDTNGGSLYGQPLGPNEIKNLAIKVGEYVHAYLSGAFHLTLVTPDATLAPGDLLQWNATAARPTGKGGTGAWTKTGATAANASFIVEEFRPLPDTPAEGIVTVRSVGAQF